MINLLARAAAAACMALLAACAVPQIDRFMLKTERATVRLESGSGPLSRQQSEKILAELKRKSPQDGLLERHIAVEEALGGTALKVGNKVVLLQDGEATYRSMLEAIRGARHHIHFETYIFEADEVGRRFAEALKARRRAGVEVRLVYDAVGSIGTPREFFQDLVAAGVEVVEYNPITPGAVLTLGMTLQRRNHRKLTIVDGRIAFLGGINISGVYTSGSVRGQKGGVGGSGDADKPRDDHPWRDTQVRLEGPVVEDLQRGFLTRWARLAKEAPLSGRAYFPPLAAQGPHIVRAVEGSPDEGANKLYVTLISAIESADDRVKIAMAYFVPHEELLGALKGAARRGVKVQLLLPSHTDNWMVLAAGRSYYAELLEAGVMIHERKTRLLHSKTVTIDGVWSTVGSTNLDWRSLAYNDEINAVILGTEFAAAMEAAFENDLANAERITPEAWSRRPLQDRLKEATARAWALVL